MVTFLDFKTKYLENDILFIKDKALESFKRFKAIAKNESGKNIKRLVSNNGGEFINKRFLVILNTASISIQYSAPYTVYKLIKWRNRTY